MEVALQFNCAEGLFYLLIPVISYFWSAFWWSFFLVIKKILLYLIFPQKHSVVTFPIFSYPRPHKPLTSLTGIYSQTKINQKRRLKKCNALPSHIVLTCNIVFKLCFSTSICVCPCIFNKYKNTLHSLLHGNLMWWFCQCKFSTSINKKFWNGFTIVKHFTGKSGFLWYLGLYLNHQDMPLLYCQSFLLHCKIWKIIFFLFLMTSNNPYKL